MSSFYIPTRIVDAVNESLESRIKSDKMWAYELRDRIQTLRLNKETKAELSALCENIITGKRS